jgi:hypothetical protein
VPITGPPGFHWFGYYDKFQTCPDDRYVLGMRVDFEHRLYTAEDSVRLGMIDRADGDRWIELGESRAWSWQQGCMLQWRPGTATEVVWNDRDGDRFVCRVLDVATGDRRTLPRPVGTLSPCGRYALSEDYSRIWNHRPGYAYAGNPDPWPAEPAPADTAVWRLGLDTGEVRQIVSLPQLVAIPYPGQAADDMHYVNHLAWNPSGERFLMFNRWSGQGQPTRVFTAAPDGRDIRLLAAHGASHWTWRDDAHVLIWAEGAYRLYRDDGAGEPIETVWEHPNGHQTYVPGTDHEWLLTDTYPQAGGIQNLMLHHIPSRRTVPLASLPAPPAYRGEWRCDLHPRLNRAADTVYIDSAHAGHGRQIYALDIRDVIR